MPPRRPVEDDAARTFLRLASALDRRSRARDGTRLTPWNLDPVRLSPLASWAEIEEALERLRRLTRKQPRGFRREWLEDHLPTLRALIRQVRGPAPPLPRQVRDFYDLPTRPASEAELDSLRRDVRRILHVGREDGLRAAVENWEREHRVAQDAVLPTMEHYLRLARRDARKLFKLPKTERVRLVATHGRSISGVCEYTRDYQSTVKLNVDLPWTWPALRDMAAHEAYPGHHVHQATREWEYLHGDFPREAAISLAACPMGPVEEGIGENGLWFLRWDRAPEDRMTLSLNRLRWGTEVNLAFMVHREEPRRELLRYAMHSGLVDWRQAVRDVRYARNRTWASYAFCYWYGTAMIRKQFLRMDGDPALFDVLYWRPHTVRTLTAAFRRL